MNAFEGHSSAGLGTGGRFPASRRGLAARRRVVVASVVALLMLGGIAAELSGLAGGGGSVSTVRAHSLATEGSFSLPASVLASVSQAVGATSPEYRAHRSAGEIRIANPNQKLRGGFDREGVALHAGRTQLSLRLTALGMGSALVPVAPVNPRSHANRVVYSRPRVEEWYVNGPVGLEQGFTVAAPPAHQAAGPLTLALTTRVNASAVLARHGHTIKFGAGAGSSLRYSGLTATDAHGRQLPSWMSLSGDRILLHVGTRGARFPVRIDPFFQNGAKHTGEGEQGKAEFGLYTALSRDGKTALIGAPLDNEKEGAAFVFTRSGNTWTQQGEKLTGGAEELEKAQFGGNVALSADGNTALIGGILENGQRGAVWVFTRSGGKWTQQGKKLQIESKTEMEDGGQFGSGMALSADGNTAIIGGQTSLVEKKTNGGGVWVFKRSGETWEQQGEVLWHEGSYFGCIIRASADASTVLITACYDVPGEFGAARGTVIAYTRKNGVWHEQATLIGEGNHNEEFGETSLSADGNTALIGAESYNSSRGGVYVFRRTGETWSREPKVITAPGEGIGWSFGSSVALSGNGNTVFVNGHDAIWEFHHSDSGWTEVGGPTEAAEQEAFTSFPGSMAVSDDGTTLLTVASTDVEHKGAVWFFKNSPVVENEAASEAKTSTAHLSADVNPGGEEVTECVFEYGTTTSYGSSVPCGPAPGSGEGPVPVAAELKGLSTGSLYHFRIAATSAHGTTYGSDEEFTTLATVATGETAEVAKPAKATDGELSVEASGGTGKVTVGTYGTEIGGPAFADAATPYFQVYRSEGSSFTKVEYKDCELDGAKAIWWYNTATGWEPIEEPVSKYTESPTPCITITATEKTKPSIAQLSDPRHVGGPSGGHEFGKCESEKHGQYEDGGCEKEKFKEKHEKREYKGKYTWIPDPVPCLSNFKHGKFSDANCSEPSENPKKTKGTGTHERGVNSWTSTGGKAILKATGLGTVTCTTSSSSGEMLDSKVGTETVTYGGCSTEVNSETKQCSAGPEETGVIRTELLETYAYEEVVNEKPIAVKALSERPGTPVAVFHCGTTRYELTGDVAGNLAIAENTMAAGSEVSFLDEPEEPGLKLNGYPTTLTWTATITNGTAKERQASEYRKKPKA